MKFSVVVPLHDKEPYVARAIESVLAQTHSGFELIVVDDASTDRGPEIVRSFDDPRVRLLRRDVPGPGGYAARNLGIREARNEWIAFLDADDLWKPDFLAENVRLHEKFPDARALCSAFVDKWPDRETSNVFSQTAGAEPFSRDWIGFLKTVADWKWPFWTGVAVFRREDLLASGGFPEKEGYGRGGDLDTWFRTMHVARTWAWSPRANAVYFRDVPGQVTRTVRQKGRPLLETLAALIAEKTDPEERSLLERCRRSCRFAATMEMACRRNLRWKDLFAERRTFSSAELLRIAAKKLESDCRAARRAVPLLGRMGRRGWTIFLLCAALAGFGLLFEAFALLFARPLPAAVAQTIYSSGFENGESCWASYREPPAPCAKPLWKEGTLPEIDADPAEGPGHAVRFDLRFDQEKRATRSELRLPKSLEPAFAQAFRKRRDFEYGFRLFFPEDYAYDSKPEIVAQWRFHDHEVRKGVKSTGSPNVSLQIQRDSLFLSVLGNRKPIPADAPEKTPGYAAHKPKGSVRISLGPLPKGRWISFLFQIRWGRPDGGIVRLRMDDSLVADWTGRNMYVQPGQPVPYFKIGIYKWPWKTEEAAAETLDATERVLWMDDLSVRAGWSGRP